MEARSVAISKRSFFNYIFPSNLGLNATDIIRARTAGLDASRLLADLHVGYGGAVEQAQAEFSSHEHFAEGAVRLFVLRLVLPPSLYLHSIIYLFYTYMYYSCRLMHVRIV